MRHLIGNQTRTYCNTCRKVLRVDDQLSRVNKKVQLHDSVVNLGNGRHKCKSCFEQGIKSTWLYNMNPIKEECTP